VAERRYIAGGLACVLLTAAAVAPAFGASESAARSVRKAVPASRLAGAFTPSSADPRLAALFARGGLDTSNFRFTPSDQRNSNRAVTVAVRARGNQPGRDATRVALGNGTVGLAPIAYNLGVSVGWKRFAVTSDLAKVDLAGAPGSREAADLAVSYAGKRVTGRIAATADRALPGATHLVDEPSSYALDVAGSYALTRNLALTAGMRYKSERDRLTRLDDDRRDSQAVYVGTAFRF
jgi:hypothetical protein